MIFSINSYSQIINEETITYEKTQNQFINIDSIINLFQGEWHSNDLLIRNIIVTDSIWDLHYQDTILSYKARIYESQASDNKKRHIAISLWKSDKDWTNFKGEIPNNEFLFYTLVFISKTEFKLKDIVAFGFDLSIKR